MTAPVAAGPPLREVPLGDGRVLRVRAMEPRDTGPLCDLYASLDVEDRYRRFFCGSLPTHEFVGRLIESATNRGGGLVVEVVDGDHVELVAEATYVAPRRGPDPGGYLAPDFAITVARPWRGWLGSYLLDALLEHARSAGIENLQADILTANASMLSLVRRHGYATVDDDDWSEVRVLLGTGAVAPSWPDGDDRPHVLVEGRVGRWTPSNERLEGLRVWRCPTSDDGNCPALRGGRCPLVDGADAIVIAPVREDQRWSQLEEAHSTGVPGVAVFVDDGHASEADVERVAVAARRHRDERTRTEARARGEGRCGPTS